MGLRDDLNGLTPEELRGLLSDSDRQLDYIFEYNLNNKEFYNVVESILESKENRAGSTTSKKATRSKKTTRRTGRTKTSKIGGRKKRAGKKTRVVRQPGRVNSVSEARQIVLRQFDEAKGRLLGRHEPLDMNRLIEAVKVDLHTRRVELDLNTPIEGYVSHILYEHAETMKFPNVAKRDLWTRCLKSPVMSDEIEKLLGVSLSKEDIKRMMGELDEDHVNANYILHGGKIKRQIETDSGDFVLSESPNIDGVQCWDGPGKSKIRRDVVDLLDKHVVSAIKMKSDAVLAKVKPLDERLLVIDERLAEADTEMKNTNDRSLTYKVWGEPYLIDQFCGDVLGGRGKKSRSVPGRKVTEKSINKYGKNHKTVSVEFDLRNARRFADEFVNKFKVFYETKVPKTHPNRLKHDINDVQTRLNTNKRKREKLSRECNTLDIEKDEIIGERESLIVEANTVRTIRYLGLEGPGFGSYLELAKLADDKRGGLIINGVFPENHLKSKNLMVSLMRYIRNKDGSQSNVFDGDVVAWQDIDNWVLLDFTMDPNIKIVDHGRGKKVTYGPASLNLDTYERALSEVDRFKSEGTTPNLISGKIGDEFGLKSNFANGIVNRFPGKFNFVFLDYVGQFTENRAEILEKLVKRRLDDEAVVALTVNTQPRFGSDLEGRTFDQTTDVLIKNCGYNIDDFIHRNYTDGKDPMAFHAYFVKKD